MYARTFGATTQGVDGLIISVEVDSANGMPAFDIVGLPNAGKSTLFNKLLGFERAIVSSVPGTTRDFIAETC